MNVEKEFRSFSNFELRDGEDGTATLVGYAAVFNEEVEIHAGFRESIAAGAFAKSIREDDVRALWNHDTNIVLGRNRNGTLRLSEDDRGLRVEIDTPSFAKDYVEMVRRGDVSQMSFGFAVREHKINYGDDSGTVTREIHDVQLFEVSPVTFPAYDSTEISVRKMQAWKDSRNQECAEFVKKQVERAARKRRMRMLSV